MKAIAVAPLVLGIFQFDPPHAHAEALTDPSVTELCRQATLIVEGTWKGGNQVAITRFWRAPEWVVEGGKVLQVDRLGDLNRIPFSRPFVKGKGQPITSQNVTLFLQLGHKGESWTPLYLVANGCPGVFWWDEKNCYHYRQAAISGRYDLVLWIPDGVREKRNPAPGDLQTLRKAIERLKRVRNPIGDSRKRRRSVIRENAPRRWSAISIQPQPPIAATRISTELRKCSSNWESQRFWLSAQQFNPLPRMVISTDC